MDSNYLSYGCGRIIPNVLECQEDVLPKDKPRFVFVDVSDASRIKIAYEASRAKIPVALRGVTEEILPDLNGLRAISRRNHAPAVLLGSWRYFPAVAAMKEIVNSGCLGQILTIDAAQTQGGLSAMRLADVKSWLGITAGNEISSEYDMALHLQAELGWIKAEFSLDGKKAQFTANINGHEKTRIIPEADPAISELAVLAMTLPAEGRIKSLPMLMTL